MELNTAMVSNLQIKQYSEKIERHNIYIGSIEDIAIGGDIESLRLGYAFGKSIEEFQINEGEQPYPEEKT